MFFKLRIKLNNSSVIIYFNMYEADLNKERINILKEQKEGKGI